MIKNVNVANISINAGIVSAQARIIHDDKSASGLQCAFELEGNAKLTQAAQALTDAVKETLKTKLGIAPTFAE